MESIALDQTLEQLRTAIETNDLTKASEIVESLRPADQADLFHDLDEAQQQMLLPTLRPENAADILEELYDEDVAEIAVQLPLSTLIRIVNEMEPDEAADLLDDLSPEQITALLPKLKSRRDIESLSQYADDTAGGLMTTHPVLFHRRMTAEQAIEALRGWRPDNESIYYLFVTDQLKRLVGVISLRQLIVAPRNKPLAEIMDTDVVYVNAETDQEVCAEILQRYDLLALPVVDEDNKLLGIITIDDLMDVLQAEASEDIQRLAGTEPLDRAYLDTSVFAITRKRIGWLFLLFFTGTLTTLVSNLYEEQLQAMVILTFFIPLLIGTGGNAGSQTTATIIRAIAVGDIEWHDGLRVLRHEIGVGLVLGSCMSICAFVLVFLWKMDYQLALTIASSIMVIVLWANSAGSLLPLVATKIGLDPTVVSGPAMSTLVDATGLLIYFNIARLLLGV